jgi:signal peptidase I
MAAVSVLRRYALTAATILVAAVWFVMLRPTAMGGPATYMMVRGSSMTGTLGSGDLIVVIAADHYDIGDVIAYRIPDGPGKGDLVIHRIIGGDDSGYVTQGDANRQPDPWRPGVSDIDGKLQWRVAGLGQYLVLGHNPPVLGLIWALVAFVLTLALTAPKRTWEYTKVMGLRHWPLAPAERPSWTTQAVYRRDIRAHGDVLQVWSKTDKEWIDVLVPEDKFGRVTWFGGSTIEFGDPMVVEATEEEVDDYLAVAAGGTR